MQPSFNINRPPVTDEEVDRHKNFDQLVAQFKKQSLKQARGDESWWKNKKVQYSSVIMGLTVVCTVTYLSISHKQKKATSTHDKITTSTSPKKPVPAAAPYMGSQLPKLDKKSTVYTVNNQKGAILRHATSTLIKVPAKAFVDMTGKEIIGDVRVEYREFQDLAEIVAAGIPMRHDSLARPYQLESAGMFEISASSKGVPAFVSKEKSLRVELASYNSGPQFVQYFLDTAARNWRYMGADPEVIAPPQPVVSTRPLNKIKLLEHDIQVVIPARTDSVEKHYSALLQQIKKPAAPAKPARSTKGRPSFSLDGSYEEFPELSAFSNVLFEVGPENKNYSPEFHEITWSDVKVSEGPVKGKNYLLSLSYRSRREQLVVYPVLSGTDYEVAAKTYETNLTRYRAIAEQKEQERLKLVAEMDRRREDLKRQAREKEATLQSVRMQASAARAENSNFDELSTNTKLLRVFNVSRMGIYNSDCAHSLAESKQIVPSYSLKGTQAALYPETTYLINHTYKSVINGNGALSVVPGSDYSLCVIKEGRIYTCDKETFRLTLGQKQASFTLTEQPGAVDNLSGLRKALEI